MNHHELYMQRCFDLARLGEAHVAPNPMVGAVLVAEGQIIGEGWHEAYGQAHAEVNAVASVPQKYRHLLPKSTLYVSLEPCCIFGRTPPCTDLIKQHNIPKVVVSCLDLTPEVSGHGVQLLRAAGVEVITGVLETKGRQLAAIRNTFVRAHRPYIVLKYARTRHNIFAKDKTEQTWLTGPYFRRLTHRWRTETQAILVGSTTVIADNPRLTDRYFNGPQPLRIVIDRNQKTQISAHVFQDGAPTLLVTSKQDTRTFPTAVTCLKLNSEQPTLPILMAYLYDHKISHLTVEGGAYTITQFVDAKLWDEARVATSPRFLSEGILAPILPVSPTRTFSLDKDQLEVYYAP